MQFRRLGESGLEVSHIGFRLCERRLRFGKRGEERCRIDSSQLPVCLAANSSVEKKKITTAQATAGAQAEKRSPRVTPW